MSGHDDDDSWGFGPTADAPIDALIDKLEQRKVLTRAVGDLLFAALEAAHMAGELKGHAAARRTQPAMEAHEYIEVISATEETGVALDAMRKELEASGTVRDESYLHVAKRIHDLAIASFDCGKDSMVME